jgi:thioredoxin reductase (NADPH)
MITPQEVRAVPIFAQLGDAELERLARRSADLHLQRGEYATHEGERAALFVMLEGEADVTRSIDGIERVVGHRVPGQLFGEVSNRAIFMPSPPPRRTLPQRWEPTRSTASKDCTISRRTNLRRATTLAP